MVDTKAMAAQLNAQLRDALLTGSASGYHESHPADAARPHNVHNALWRLGLWDEDGELTPLGEQVRAHLL